MGLPSGFGLTTPAHLAATNLDRPSPEERLDPDKDERGTGEGREQRGFGPAPCVSAIGQAEPE
jgi:hypothetical protein